MNINILKNPDSEPKNVAENQTPSLTDRVKNFELGRAIILSNENRARLNGMTEKAIGYADAILKYRGTSVEQYMAEKAAGDEEKKMEQYQVRAIKIGGKLEDMNRQIEEQKKAFKLLEEQADIVGEFSGTAKANMKLQMLVLQKGIHKSIRDRDRLNTEYQYQMEQTALFSQRRNNAVDQYMGKIEITMMRKPEQTLESLEKSMAELEEAEIIMKEKHQKIKDKLSLYDRNKTEDALKLSKMSKKDIGKTLASIEKTNTDCLEQMRLETKALAKRRIEIQTAIADANDQLAPHLDKWHDIQRMKEIQPISNEKATVPQRKPVNVQRANIRPRIN